MWYWCSSRSFDQGQAFTGNPGRCLTYSAVSQRALKPLWLAQRSRAVLCRQRLREPRIKFQEVSLSFSDRVIPVRVRVELWRYIAQRPRSCDYPLLFNSSPRYITGLKPGFARDASGVTASHRSLTSSRCLHPSVTGFSGPVSVLVTHFIFIYISGYTKPLRFLTWLYSNNNNNNNNNSDGGSVRSTWTEVTLACVSFVLEIK